jgi:hypothetical protein
VIGGLLVVAFVVSVYAVRPLPLFVLRALGVYGGNDLRGGLAMTYVLPDGAQTRASIVDRLRERLEGTEPAARVTYRPPATIDLELPGVPAEEVEATAAILTNGGVQFAAVIADDPFMRQVYAMVAKDPSAAADGVEASPDSWMADDGRRHTDYYLFGADPDAIHAYLHERGVEIPAGHELLFEHVVGAGDEQDEAYWRSYFVESTVLLDGTSIVDATVSYDPQTSRPIVLVDFDDDGAQRFGEITERLVGEKLATLVGAEVKSAPIINGPIYGGRISITMGGSDPDVQEREARALVSVLRFGALPPGGTIERAVYVAPSVTPARLWLARILLGLVAGALAFVVVLVIGRRSRAAPPAFPPSGGPGAADRPAPWWRLAVTLCAPLVVWFQPWVHMPALVRRELENVVRDPDLVPDFSAFALGLGALIAAFVVVELAALAVPSWRRFRLTPLGRRRLGIATVLLACVIAAIQGYQLAHRFQALLDPWVIQAGNLPVVQITATCVGATLVLGVIAALIGEHGLGNGFSALLASGVVVGLVRYGIDDPAGQIVAGIAGMVLAGVATAWLASRRFAERDDAAPIAPPIAGLLPVLWPVAITAVVGAAAVIGIDEPRWLPPLLAAGAGTWLVIGLVVIPLVLAIGLGWVLARPDRTAAMLARMTGANVTPDRRAWAWAAAASALWIALLVAITAITPAYPVVWTSAGAAIVAMAVLDHVAAWRAHRRADLVGVWPIHDAAMADVALRVLAGAGIAAHLRGRHHRSLYQVLGPFLPIEVMVPADRAGEASAILRDMFDPASRGVTTAW